MHTAAYTVARSDPPRSVPTRLEPLNQRLLDPEAVCDLQSAPWPGPDRQGHDADRPAFFEGREQRRTDLAMGMTRLALVGADALSQRALRSMPDIGDAAVVDERIDARLGRQVALTKDDNLARLL